MRRHAFTNFLKISLANNYNSVIIGRISTLTSISHMFKCRFLRQTFSHYVLLIAGACFMTPPLSRSVHAQVSTEQSVVVSGEEVPSSYGAPPGLSRSRFSNTTQAYVLPPWAFFFGEIYEGQGFRHGPPDHLFTQEIEMGLPYRFGVAAEAKFERFNGGGGAETASVEARWALADWNKIPLNPTLFAEYKFGVGTIRHEEGPPPPAEEEEEEESGPPKVPDAYEFRLLLAQDFGERVEWAMNWFFERENTGDRGREWGFSQSAMVPILLPNERLKVGVEMEYKNFTVKDTRGDPMHTFIIGPTFAWKPTAGTRLDISPLFGCTDDSPVVDVFVAFSWLFGGERAEAEAPVSTRFRYYTGPAGGHSGKEMSGKEMKQVAPPPCPQWYGDNEWNLNLWGTYVFTNTEYSPNLDIPDLIQSTTEGHTVEGSFDHYIGNDHAWGGGGDIKYFFHRYFGIGLEGFALNAHKRSFDIDLQPLDGIFVGRNIDRQRVVGAILGTFTLRYPIPCTRFAPYAWAGGGAIFGGGESDSVTTQPIPGLPNEFPTVNAQSHHFDGETKAIGHFGFGLEVRFTRNIGWTNDLSWGVIEGPKNNFTMVRSGINFAF